MFRSEVRLTITSFQSPTDIFVDIIRLLYLHDFFKEKKNKLSNFELSGDSGTV